MSTRLADWLKESPLKQGERFLDALSQFYISISVLELDSHSAVVLSSTYDRDFPRQATPWETLLARFVDAHVYAEDRERVLDLFSCPSLSLFCDGGAAEKNVEIRCRRREADAFEWVELTATVFDRAARQILVTTKNISETSLQKRVLNQYLYHQDCDFFILLSLGENSYRVFDSKKGLLPIPQMGCSDYTADMLLYNNKYVVKSESEKISALMAPENIRVLLSDRDEYAFTAGLMTDSGEYRRAKMQFISFDRTKNLVILARTDITQIYLEEKQRSEQLLYALHAAQRDMLTGLYNQATTETLVSQMLSNYQGDLAAILFIDVDNFKMVNDTLGHLQGNELLRGFAALLRELAVGDRIAGRVGGDEFLLYLPGAATVEEICSVGLRICHAFEQLQALTAGLPVSCSVGISLYPQDGLSYDVLVRKADQALYSAKRHGKNHYYLYSGELETHTFASALSEIDGREIGVRNGWE